MQDMIQQPTTELPLELPAWCQHVLSNSDQYVVIDTETTGLGAHSEVIDLAIVGLDGTILFNELLKPTCPIEPDAAKFHHITEDMVSSARTFAEAWTQIHDAIGVKAVIGYNVIKFDKRLLEQTARAHGIPFPSREWHCLMIRYAEFYAAPNERGYGGPGWQKLENALPQQGVSFAQEHRALSDAQAVVKLIRRLAELGDNAVRWTGEEEE